MHDTDDSWCSHVCYCLVGIIAHCQELTMIVMLLRDLCPQSNLQITVQ